MSDDHLEGWTEEYQELLKERVHEFFEYEIKEKL